MNRRTALRAIPFAVIALAHLVAQAVGADLVADLTQLFAMPALLLVLLAPHPDPNGDWPHVRRWATIALVLSWVGDSLPRILPEGVAFIGMLVPFLLAQLAWLVAMLPRRRQSIWFAQRWRLGLYGVLLIGVLALVMPGTGPLLGALVVVYAVAIMLMATAATGWGALGTTGGLLFVVSDALIAVRTFRAELLPDSPWFGVLIMATYFAAQLLLVLGAREWQRRARTPVTGIAAGPAR